MRIHTLLTLPHTVRSAHRLREILAVLVRHGFGELVQQLGLQSWALGMARLVRLRRDEDGMASYSVEERIRMCFEELGPAFVKLGQVLATRPDLIPMSLVNELRKLQDDVPPFPLEEVRQVIFEDLGRPFDEAFATFTEEPLAAASIAQVHRATLKDGRQVVVKVQRPILRRIIDRDLHILRVFAQMLHGRVPELRRFELPAIVREFAVALRLEADFANERANMERFSRLWAEDPLVGAPEPVPDLCSQRVLTMEYIDGVKVTDRAALESIGVETTAIARRGTNIALRSIFEHGYFHADPHPGNFFVQKGGRVVLIDFGMMGVIDRKRLDELLSFLVSILMNDPDMMVRLFFELDLIEDTTDVRTLKREIKTIVDRYYNVPLGDIDIGAFIQQVFEVVMRHDVSLPADLLLVGKALATMEGIAQEIDPSFDPISEIRPYLMRAYVLRVLDPAQHAKDIARDLADVTLLLRQLPGEVRALLKKARKGKLQLLVSDEDTPRILDRADRRMNRALAAAAACTSLLAGTAMWMGELYVGGGALIGASAFWLFWAWLGMIRTGGP